MVPPWCAQGRRPGPGSWQWRVNQRGKATCLLPLVPLPDGSSFLALRPNPRSGSQVGGSHWRSSSDHWPQSWLASGYRGCRPLPCPLVGARCCEPQGPLTSWQFVAVCRVLLSCKSRSHCWAQRWEEVGCFALCLFPQPSGLQLPVLLNFLKAGKNTLT